MALVLFQSSHDGARPVSRARYFHSIDETEKHAAMDARRDVDYASRPGILRLTLTLAPNEGSRHRRDTIHRPPARSGAAEGGPFRRYSAPALQTQSFEAGRDSFGRPQRSRSHPARDRRAAL